MTDNSSKLVELSADSGQCVREITLQSDIVRPCQGEPSKLVELSADSGQRVREITLQSDIVS